LIATVKVPPPLPLEGETESHEVAVLAVQFRVPPPLLVTVTV
jgi:hypothetical protein